MGWAVMANCAIQINQKGARFSEKEKNTAEDILTDWDEDEITNIEVKSDFISFDITGNKGVRYDIMEALKKVLKHKDLTMNSWEWVESSDGGYCYNRREDG